MRVRKSDVPNVDRDDLGVGRHREVTPQEVMRRGEHLARKRVWHREDRGRWVESDKPRSGAAAAVWREEGGQSGQRTGLRRRAGVHRVEGDKGVDVRNVRGLRVVWVAGVLPRRGCEETQGESRKERPVERRECGGLNSQHGNTASASRMRHSCCQCRGSAATHVFRVVDKDAKG
jgi:hypothetical protein